MKPVTRRKDDECDDDQDEMSFESESSGLSELCGYFGYWRSVLSFCFGITRLSAHIFILKSASGSRVMDDP